MAVTFEQVALQYIALSESRWGAHAAPTTNSVIRRHLIARLGGLALDKLNAKDLQLLIDEMARNKASDSLLHKVVTHLRAIFDLAQESGVLRINPMRSRISKVTCRSGKTASERHLSIEECGALLGSLKGRDLLIVRMFIQLGLRPKELFALRRNDVTGNFLRIDEILVKGRVKRIATENGALGVYVPPDLLANISSWMQTKSGQENDWLFPASRPRGPAGRPPVSHDHFRNRILKAAAEKAGVHDVDLFALRRTCASFFAHHATAQDALAQMRHYNPASLAGSPDEGQTPSLKRAAEKIEVQILDAANRFEKGIAGVSIRSTSRSTLSSSIRP